MQKKKRVPVAVCEVLTIFNIRRRSYISHDAENIYTMDGTIQDAFTKPRRAKVNAKPSEGSVFGRVISDPRHYKLLFS